MLIRVYWVYVLLSAVGGYIIGYAASAKTAVDTSTGFAFSTTTHSVGAAVATAFGALLFAAFSGLPLYGIAWLLDGQVVLLGGLDFEEATKPTPAEHPPSNGTY